MTFVTKNHRDFLSLFHKLLTLRVDNFIPIGFSYAVLTILIFLKQLVPSFFFSEWSFKCLIYSKLSIFTNNDILFYYIFFYYIIYIDVLMFHQFFFYFTSEKFHICCLISESTFNFIAMCYIFYLQTLNLFTSRALR